MKIEGVVSYELQIPVEVEVENFESKVLLDNALRYVAKELLKEFDAEYYMVDDGYVYNVKKAE